MVSLLDLDPARYQAHPLHGSDREYPETNCYADSLIEFVHAAGGEPLAMLGCALPVDFEGDQWTFFKPRQEDLERFYGIDIHEMQPYRPLPQQITEKLETGRTLVLELDSFYLPDTGATSYRRAHVKSTVVVEAIDHAGERLRYFHNAGYFELAGEDYRGAFRLDGDFSDDVLPPYVELVRFDVGRRLEGEELRRAAAEALAVQVGRRPATNPFERFGKSLEDELPNLLAGDAQRYHEYAFATVRMVGAAFDLAAAHVDWILGGGGAAATARMREIVSGSKVLSLRLARRREFDPTPMVEGMAAAWEGGFKELEDAIR